MSEEEELNKAKNQVGVPSLKHNQPHKIRLLVN